MTVGSSSVSKSQSAKGSSSNSEILLRLAVPCRIESKALCATPPGLRQWIELSSEPSVLLVMPASFVQVVVSPKNWSLANLKKAKTLTVSDIV